MSTTTTVVAAPAKNASSIDSAAVVPMKSHTREGWLKNLKELPERKEGQRLPAIFYAHGHPGIYFSGMNMPIQNEKGPLNRFLRDLGPTLMKKYNPKAVVVFSAHWETHGETLVSDWGDDQPLFMDYYGFPQSNYSVSWRSSGSSQLSRRIVGLFQNHGIAARTTNVMEPRGRDGSGKVTTGLDHGVFIPNLLMFPQESSGDKFPVPLIQVSIDGSLDPEAEFNLGRAVSSLRDDGVLVLAGGLTIHTFREFSSWNYTSAGEKVKAFESAIVQASELEDSTERLKALAALKKHPGFRIANPREEHFAPIWVAAGAASEEGAKAKVLTDMHGCKTIAFGV